MGPSQLIVNAVMSIVAYAVILLAVYKIFAISAELAGIKEILKDVQRNTEDKSAEAINARIQSAAPLLHAVNSASYPEAEVENTSQLVK